MEQIPVEIEQKIENLPVIPFDGGEDFQKLISSEEFTEIFNFYKENYLPDVLKTKSEVYQRISLYLSLTNQDTQFLEQSDQVLYRRPVPDIHTFLTDKFFMGYNNATLYNFWKEKLEEIFRESSPVRKVVFGGCIGSGKSTVARKAFIYVLYRALCLRYPRAAFNIDSDATIANIVISMTLKQVYDTNLLPFVKLMETMPCFQRVMSVKAFENFDLSNPRCPIPFQVEKSTGTVFFPDNIILTCGSNQGHFTGYNVINSFCFTGLNKVHTNRGNVSFKTLLRTFKNYEYYTITMNNEGKIEQSKIIDVAKTGKVKELIRLYTDDTHYIECTPNHLFLIKNPNKNDLKLKLIHGLYYKEAQDLTENDDIESINNSYVYALIDNDINSKHYNEPFYVGVGSSENLVESAAYRYQRAHDHFSEKELKRTTNRAKRNKIKQLKAVGLPPKIYILQKDLTLQEAFKREIEYIKEYGRKTDGNGILCNMAGGGEGIINLPLNLNKQRIDKMTNTKRIKQNERNKKKRESLNALIQSSDFWMQLIIALAIRKEFTRINYKKAISYRRNNGLLVGWSKNSSEEHRKMVALNNHLHPKVSTVKSKLKLSESQKKTYWKKSEEQRNIEADNKILAKIKKVLDRISNNTINESIYNNARTKGFNGRAEPRWNSIVNRFGGIEALIKTLQNYTEREWTYEV